MLRSGEGEQNKKAVEMEKVQGYLKDLYTFLDNKTFFMMMLEF